MEKEELLEKYRYVLKINSQLADLKENSEVKQKEYKAVMDKMAECKTKWGTGTFIKCILPALLFIFVGIVTVGAIFDKDMWSFIPAGIFLMIFLCGLFSLIGTLSFARHDRDKNEIEAARIHNNELIPAYMEYEESIKRLQEMAESTNIEKIESEIPEDYRTQDALIFFIKVMETGRADTEKEVYNLYEEELHRRRLEKIEEEKLERLEASFTHCPKCGGTNCRMMMETKTESTPFGFGRACCGWIFLGPLGLLCGLCGMGTSTETKNYWVCNDCGKKFTE